MEELKLRPLRVSIFSWIFCVSSACFKILFVVPFILSCHQKCIAAVCNLVLGPFWSLSPMIVNKRDIVFIYFFLRDKICILLQGMQVGKLFFLTECSWENYFWQSVVLPQRMQLGKLFLIISHFSSGTAIGKIIVRVPNYVIQNPRNETSFSKVIQSRQKHEMG